MTMMVFSMPCFANKMDQGHETPTASRRSIRWGLVWLWLWMVSAGLTAVQVRAQTAPAQIQQMLLERSEEGVLLSATVQFELPSLVEDALRKGIPLFFLAETQTLRARWYWYDEKVATSARHARLAYQPLTRRWRVHLSPVPITSSGLGVTLGQSYEELDEALAAVQRFSRWKIAPASAVASASSYTVDFSFKLDTSQLPRPLQIGMAGRADWNLSVSQRMPLPAEAGR